MTPQEIFNHIHRFGLANENPALVAKYSRYFKGGLYDAYGLGIPQVESLVNELLAVSGMTPALIRETSLLLVESTKYEMTAMAIRLMLTYHKEWTVADFQTVEKWFSVGISNWAHTDYICGEMMNLFFKKGIADLEAISNWRTAKNKFQRRAAVVALIKPMKLSADFTPWFTFIEPMMHDPEREVHQGLGWFLREAWKKQPEVTEQFLSRYRETAPRLIFQYATEKMTKEGKERFKRNNRTFE
jgi:3-methyladenine DNA glycosylase AlkD